MKLLAFLLLLVLVFAGVAAYRLQLKGLLTREVLDLYIEREAEEEKAEEPDTDPVGLAAAIQEKQDELREETEDLKQLNAKIQAQRKEVEEQQALLERRIGELKAETEAERSATSREMQQLVKMYEGMAPEDAAGVLDNMPDPTVARVLLQMRSRQAAQIMGSMNRDKAAEVSKLLSVEGGLKGLPELEPVETP